MTARALPKAVKLGGDVYKIVLVRGLKDGGTGQSLLGTIHFTEPLIEIEGALSLERQWQVLWHELTHLFLHNMGLNEAHDETIIEALSHQINWVLAQNGASMLPNA